MLSTNTDIQIRNRKAKQYSDACREKKLNKLYNNIAHTWLILVCVYILYQFTTLL